VYRVTDRFVTTNRQWRSLAVKAFQAETIKLALESLDRHARPRRDISTVTVSIAEKDLPTLRERIAEFRNDILKMAEASAETDSVYQLNVQLFPLSEDEGGES
jgi:uncharacterized protein (TIGR02147 family)